MLKRYSLALLCACLPILRANSQPATPRRPLVVTLDSGTVTKRPLVGLDTAYYRVVRLRMDRLPLLDEEQALSAQTTAQLRAELRRCRGVGQQADAAFDGLAHDARQLEAVKPQPFVLLDPHFYQGTAVGVTLLVLLKIFVFR